MTAAPKTGVINANNRNANNVAIVKNGIKTRLLRNPGIDNVRRVTNKLVNDIVLLIPAATTAKINKSWEPTPVYFVEEEKGVIKVQPAVVKALFEHFVK
jgi:hypothetical protein